MDEEIELYFEEEYVPEVSYYRAEALRCSRRVLFEKVACRPREYLTVLTGLNEDLLVALSWECCGYLEENNDLWRRYEEWSDDPFDWIVRYHDLSEMLRGLYNKTKAEISHMEWEVHEKRAFYSLIEALKKGELSLSYFGCRS